MESVICFHTVHTLCMKTKQIDIIHLIYTFLLSGKIELNHQMRFCSDILQSLQLICIFVPLTYKILGHVNSQHQRFKYITYICSCKMTTNYLSPVIYLGKISRA